MGALRLGLGDLGDGMTLCLDEGFGSTGRRVAIPMLG